MTQLSLTKLSVALCAVFLTSVANAEVVTTDEVNVTGGTITDKSPASTTVGHKRIAREMIRDMRDLARYEQDFGLREEGRYNKGFAMRGVDGNRVGILLDGTSMPDFEENSLYAHYGKMNTSRPTIDPELVSSISLDRGSNSVETGSGAVGGSVNFRTLNPEDIVEDGKTWGALARLGYASKNREWMQTVSGAFTGEHLSTILLYSHRHGHETKSMGRGPETKGKKSQHPNPWVHNSDTYLAKVRYHFNDVHSVGLNLNGTLYDRDMYERTRGTSFSGPKYGFDKSIRHSGKLDYTYAPYDELINKAVLSGELLSVETTAITTELYENKWNPTDPDIGKPQEIDDRRFKTQFGRIAASIEFAPIEFYGEHNIDARIFASKRHIENHNSDFFPLYPATATNPYVYAIQRPMDTTDRGLVLGDSIRWYPDWVKGHDSTVTMHLGTRIEKSSHQPQEPDIPCTRACEKIDPGLIVRKSFTNTAFNFGLDYELDRQWKVGYSLASGFRNPSATELYFVFDNPYGNWRPNPGLKPEKSLTHNLFFQADTKTGSLNVNLYRMDYKDFLFEDEFWINDNPTTCTNPKWCKKYTLQMVNLDEAHITGFEASGSLNLDIFNSKLKGTKLMGSLGYAQGKTPDGISLLAIQPFKAVLGFDYEHPNKTYGVYGRMTYTARKHANEAKHRNLPADIRYEGGDLVDHKWLNKASTVFDLFGWYSPKKNVTIRAGVFNIFNKRYHTWDALRGITEYSNVNGVDSQNLGLQRYYSPGRNYSLTLEMKF